MFTEWQNTTKKSISSLRASLKEKKKTRLTEEERIQLKAAENMLNKIELDGSSGVHNYFFIEETLNSLKKKYELSGKILQEK